MNLPVKGIIPPVVTPLLDNDKIDIRGLERLVEHLVTGGVHGLFILGTTGESVSLTYKTRKELIKRTAVLVNKRIPVFVGITDTSFNGSLEIADFSAANGIDAVVVAPPYYLPISQEEMRVYLENLIPELPLPCMLYNMPGCTKMHLSIETVRFASTIGVIGIKDSSGDMLLMHQLIKEFEGFPGFSILTGTELFIPETVISGGHGGVPGGANIFPRLFVDLYNASLRKETEKINSLLTKLGMINDLIYNAGKHNSRYIKGIKSALSVMGICNDYAALPLRSHNNDIKEKIAEAVREILA